LARDNTTEDDIGRIAFAQLAFAAGGWHGLGEDGE
jgi:hypothetical protein